MAKRFMDRLEHAWNAFRGQDDREPRIPSGGYVSYGARPDRPRPNITNYNRIIMPILTQIANDAAGVEMKHVRSDKDGNYVQDMVSALSHTFEIWPNLDQGPTQFRRDAIMTMFEEGVVAIVPVETTVDPEITGGYDIQQLRVGTITQWYPGAVAVRLYDERNGQHTEVIVDKKNVAIVENPHYSVMNEPNSSLQRLMRKLSQLDITDERASSGKLDIILQLPYTIKHESRLREAKQRTGDIEEQLVGSKYGIGFIDATERITQLNRPAENNLLAQVTDLEKRVYTQMGLTDEIFFGTADESAMLNYQNRTVFPIVRAFQEEYKRKFLTKTALTRGQDIKFFRNPFGLVPVSQIAEIADKFTRNEIMAPNEFRPIVGLRPVDDPEANELRNRNMPKVDPAEESKEEPEVPEEPEEPEKPEKELRTNESRREEEDEA